MNKLLELVSQFEARDNKKYKNKFIIYSAVYGKETESYISGFFYLVL